MTKRQSSLRALSGPLLGLFAVLLLFVIIFTYRGELHRFFNRSNIQVLIHGDSYVAVAALGMLLIMLSGGIDLSTGSVVALVGVVTMQVYKFVFARSESTLISTLAGVPAGIGVGGLCGFVNGIVITRLRVLPFVATLGMLSIARGLAVWLSEGHTVNFPVTARPRWVDHFANVDSDYTYFNPGFWLMLALAAGVAFMLHRTVLGRYCYAIGSNEQAARLSGIRVENYKVAIYTLAGLLTGVAGILLFAILGSGEHSSAKELELQVIAALVVGGVSLSGGQGTVVGALLGVLVLAILKNGVNNCQVPVEVQYIMIGVIIIANTALSRWQKR